MTGVLLAIGLVSDFREIGRAWTRALFAEQRIIARALALLRDRTLRVGEVAEADGVSRARLLAGGHHFALADAAVLDVRLHLSRLDPLDAVGAFLHDPATAHRHVGVALRLGRSG